MLLELHVGNPSQIRSSPFLTGYPGIMSHTIDAALRLIPPVPRSPSPFAGRPPLGGGARVWESPLLARPGAIETQPLLRVEDETGECVRVRVRFHDTVAAGTGREQWSGTLASEQRDGVTGSVGLACDFRERTDVGASGPAMARLLREVKAGGLSRGNQIL